MRKPVPLGIRVLCDIYLLNLVLFILSQILYCTLILILGNEAGGSTSLVVRFVFIFTPLYLFLRLKRLKIDAWVVSIIFHLFFVINNGLGYLEYYGVTHSLVRITGIYGSIIFTPAQRFVLISSMIMNIFILGYLFDRRKLFIK